MTQAAEYMHRGINTYDVIASVLFKDLAFYRSSAAIPQCIQTFSDIVNVCGNDAAFTTGKRFGVLQ